MLSTVKIFFKKEGKIKKLSGKHNSRESGANSRFARVVTGRGSN